MKQDTGSDLPKLLQRIYAVEYPAQKQLTNLHRMMKLLHAKMNIDIRK